MGVFKKLIQNFTTNSKRQCKLNSERKRLMKENNAKIKKNKKYFKK